MALPKVGAEVELDLGSYNNDIQTVIDKAGKADAALKELSGDVTVKVNIDDSEVGLTLLALDDLTEDASVKVNVDDAELGTAVKQVDELDSAAPNVKINTDDTELDDSLSILKDIRNLSVIEVSLSLSERAQGIIETIRSLPGIGQTLSNDNATAILQAPTGAFDPEELALAQNLFANNMTESVEAAALLINQLKALGVEKDSLDDAANGAVNAAQAFIAVGQDAEASEIAIAAHQLVINGLVDSYEEAADVIASGVGAGLNKGDDFLDTIREYASTFGTTKTSAEEFLSILNTGLEAGFDNTDRIADLYREGTLRGLNPDETAAQDSLKALGLADETQAFQAGEITGAEWFKGVLSAIETEPDAGKQQMFGANILGTQVEDFGLDTVLGIDTIDATFDHIENRAAEVSTLLNDTIGNDFTELFNTINLEVADLLSSDKINLDEKIQAIKDGFTNALDVIQEGGTVGEAIEIGLNIPGFNDGVNRFEASIGNFAISVLEIVAGVQEFLGKDSSGTRGQIAQLERGQLAFDLQVANGDEIAGEFKTAIDRGLSTSDIATATQTALTELIAGGELDKAQALVDSLKEISEVGSPVVAPGLNGLQISTANAALREGSIERIQEQIDAGNLIAPVSVDTAAFQTEIDAAVEAAKPEAPPGWWDNFNGDNVIANIERPDPTKFGVGAASGKGGGEWWTNMTPPPETVTAIDDFSVSTEDAMNNAALVTSLASDGMLEALTAMSDGVVTADEQIAMSLTENTVTTSFEMVAESAQENFGAAGDFAIQLVGEIAYLDRVGSGYIADLSKKLHDLQFLSAQVAAGVEAALAMGANLPAGGGGGGGTNVNNNNSTNNSGNNSNNRQTTINTGASTYDVARAINGV